MKLSTFSLFIGHSDFWFCEVFRFLPFFLLCCLLFSHWLILVIVLLDICIVGIFYSVGSSFIILVTWWIKVLVFKEVQFINYLVLFCFHLWNLYLPPCQEVTFLFSFKSFIFSPFIFKSIYLIDSSICKK